MSRWRRFSSRRISSQPMNAATVTAPIISVASALIFGLRPRRTDENTFIGSVYKLFGLQNIADQAKGADSGYPQLSAEYVVKAAPDLVVLADTKCCQQTEATLAKRPAFDTLPA